MMESAVQLLHLVQSMKVTVTVTLNAKETLPVGQTIVLPLFHLMRIAVLLPVRKYYDFNQHKILDKSN
jgi:hypothetical protein